MNKINHVISISLFCLYSISTTASAVDVCKGSNESSKFFPNTLIVSKKISKAYCQNSQSAFVQNPQFSELKRLVILWKNTILDETKQIRGSGIGIELEPYFEKLSVEIGSQNQKGWPSFFVNPDVINGGYRFNIDRSGLADGTFDNLENAKCEKLQKYKADCFDVLKELEQAVNAYKTEMVIEQTDITLKKLKVYTYEWEEYFTKARSQTPWELALNSALYKDEITRPTFVLPPQYQMIALHPDILLENVNGANAGSQFKESLAVEWLGVNYWNMTIPLGVSIMSTYTDRAGVSNVGHGILFHINNNYSIGLINYVDKTNGDKIGVSISVDLLKLFETRKAQIENYEKYIANN